MFPFAKNIMIIFSWHFLSQDGRRFQVLSKKDEGEVFNVGLVVGMYLATGV